MTFLHRAFRIFWISLAVILLGVSALAFVLVKTAEHVLRTETRVGEWRVQFYGARVSSPVSFQADSAVFHSDQGRIFVTGISAHLLDWSHLWSRRGLIRVMADSGEARFAGSGKSPSPTPQFPELRFPLSVLLQWRTFNVLPDGGPVFGVDHAEWRSNGPWGLKGNFQGRWRMQAGAPFERAEFSVDARWRGKSVRYRLEARHGEDTLRVSGSRQKTFLPRGEDSLQLVSMKPGQWLPAAWRAGIPEFGDVRLRGKMDLERRKLSLSGTFHTGDFQILEPIDWKCSVRDDSSGGRLELEGRGSGRQAIRWQGEWKHPPEDLAKPEWKRYAAQFSGEVHGVRWQIGKRTLPVDFEVPSLRLDPGLAVTARVVTVDGSSLDLHWNGGHPAAFQFSGPISPRETWATIWTDSNVSFRSARVDGTWEDKKFKVTAWLQGVLAYKAEADSVRAYQEISPQGYFLREGRIYHQGQVFQASGDVDWAPHPGRETPSLAFDLSHPEFGAVHFAMPMPDSLTAEARDVHVAEFPYAPAWRFLRFHPVVNGRFAWNPATGAGASEARVSFSYQQKEIVTRASAAWDNDSLYLHEAEVQSGASRLSGKGTLGLGGQSLAGLSRLNPDAVGFVELTSENVRVGEVLDLINPIRGSAVVDGLLDGNIRYDLRSGWRGDLRASDIRVPALRGLVDVTDLSISGRGDSLLLSTRTASTRHALLTDTLEARLSGLRSGSPQLGINVRSGSLHADFTGELAGWKELRGSARVAGRAALGGAVGTVDQVDVEGDLSIPFQKNSGPRFASRQFQLRYAVAADTQWLDGRMLSGDGMLTVPDLRVKNSEGGEVKGQLQARLLDSLYAHADFAGSDLQLSLPQGQHVQAHEVSGSLNWEKGGDLRIAAQAQSGSFRASDAPLRIEGGFDDVKLECSIPPADATALPKIVMRARVHDFLFQRNMGFNDVKTFFRGVNRQKENGSPSSRRSKPWDMDLQLEAVGSTNRVDTDVLRLAFLGDLEVKGVYPYTLFNGKISGLQGEIGLSGQSYDVSDFEVKWDNSTLDEGTVYVEGTKKLLEDCLPNTTRTCSVFIKLNGQLSEMNFGYDTDCDQTGQNAGEPMSPAMLINWASQGCASPESQNGGAYSTAVGNAVTPIISQGITKGFKKAGLGGIIQSTQVSGLGALVGGDTSGMEPLAVEVKTQEKYRLSLTGKAGYYPERKLADPWEYKLAGQYRPPLEKVVKDSAWQARFRDRLTVEMSVETLPPDLQAFEQQQQVRQEVGLHYRYRFWNWW